MDHSHHHHTHPFAIPTTNSPLDWIAVGAMLAYSFTVSAHCAAMCGPLLVNALASPEHSRQRRLLSLLQYQLGRLLSYTAAGAFFGWLGQSASRFTSRFEAGQIWFSLTFGSLLLAWGLVQLVSYWGFSWGKRPLTNGEWTIALTRVLTPLIEKMPRTVRVFLLGLVTVFFPCMTLSPVLIGAAAGQSPVAGAALLLAFFLGTLPVMTGVGLFALIRSPNWAATKIISAVFLIVAGLVTILRATPLHHYLH